MCQHLCCSYAVEVLKTVLLQSCSIAIMLVVLSATFILVDLFTASIKFLYIYARENVYTANMWLTIFIEIMHMEVSVTIMQVVFSTVHYEHD